MREDRSLEGVIAPMLTPCFADGSLDEKGVWAYFEYLAGMTGVNAVFVRSGMGRMFTFTVPEVEQIARVALQAGKRYGLGVIVGAAGEWLRYREGEKVDPEVFLGQTLHLVKYCGQLGVEAVMLVVPFMLPPGENPQKVVLDYFRAVNRVARLPVFFYQPPGTPRAYRLTPTLLEQVLTLKRFEGAKIASFEWQEGQTRKEAIKEWAKCLQGTKFRLICGDEAYYLPVLEGGGVGVIGEGCNVYPEILNAIRSYWQQGDRTRAEKAQEDVQRGLQLVKGLNGAVVWKQVMIRQGLKIQPYDREGVPPYPDEIVIKIAEELERLRKPYLIKRGKE